MVQETQRSIAAVWMKAIPESREGIVTITVASSSSFSSSSQYNVLNDSKYDSMPAEFARPLKGHDIKARLINFDRDDGDDDGDDTLCPITDPFDAMDKHAREGTNIWGSSHTDAGIDKNFGVTVGDTVISQGLDAHNGDDDLCLSDKPVALLVSRGNCTFEDKAMEALTNPPYPLLQNQHQNYRTAVSYLIIYDNQPHEQEQQYRNPLYHIEDDSNDTHPSPPLIRMNATNKDKKILMEDMPITLFFVSHETGMALKQAMHDSDQYPPNDGSGKDEDCNDKGGVMVTFNLKDSLYEHRNHVEGGFVPRDYHSGYYKSHSIDMTKDTDNDDGNTEDDNYYPSYQADPTRLLLVQMITAVSLMFTFFFCIGCLMVCCCGHPGEEGWFTISLDGNGVVFGRAESDGDAEVRLLTEEEVLNLPQVGFIARRDSDDGDSDNGDLELGPSKSMDADDTSPETLLIRGHIDTDSTTGSSPVARSQPLRHQCSSSLNHDSLSFNAMCSICLEEYEEGEMLRMLPCHHMFHTECIVPWLTERFPNCPLCKAHVIAEQQETEDGNLEDDDEEVGAAVEGQEGDDDNSIYDEEVMEGRGGIERNDEPSFRNFFEIMASRRNAINASAAADAARNEVENDRIFHQQQSSDNVGNGGRGGESLSHADQVMSNLSTPLLQDSRSPGRSSSSSLS